MPHTHTTTYVFNDFIEILSIDCVPRYIAASPGDSVTPAWSHVLVPTLAFESIWDRQVQGLGTSDLVDRLQMLDQQRRHLEAEIVEVMHEVDRRELFRDDRHTSVKGWARAHTRWSDGEARARARLARLVAASPAVAHALATGTLGVAQAHELGRVYANPRVRDEFDDVVAIFLEHSEHMSFEDFRSLVTRWESIADADGAFRSHEASHRRRRASMFVNQTVVSLQASGGTVDGAAMLEVFERYKDAEYLADWAEARAIHGDSTTASHLPRTAAQRSWDALARIFNDAASAPPGSVSPEPVLNVVMDATTMSEELRAFARRLAEIIAVHDGSKAFDTETIMQGLMGGGSSAPWPTAPAPPVDGTLDVGALPTRPALDLRFRGCWSTNGVPLPRSVLIEALLLGRVRRIVVDGAGVPIDVGRRRRFFTKSMREVVFALIARCTWPGCSRPSGQCDADHTLDFQHGGHTATANLGPECWSHNPAKNAGFTVWRDPSGYWHTYRPDGTEIR
jgi:hypothetical protein